MKPSQANDENEAIYRAEWLTKHGAPIDWTIVTKGESDAAKRAFAAMTAERDALKAENATLRNPSGRTIADGGEWTREEAIEMHRRKAEAFAALTAERDALKADKERLDWLDRIDEGAFDWFNHPRNVRAAIDDALGKEQP